MEKRIIHPGLDPLTVVIPVKDMDDQITTDCLRHLALFTPGPLVVYLVESSGPEFSYGRSINEGIKRSAPADIVICMDSDAFPERHAQAELVNHLKNDSSMGYIASVVRPIVTNKPRKSQVGWTHCGLGRFLLNAIKQRAPLFALRRLLLGKYWSFGVDIVHKYKPGRMVGATTTMFAIRRSCFDAIGPFDERFHVSFSDVDYCYRILTSEDWFLSSCPNSVVVHDAHKTRGSPKERTEFEDLKLFLSMWSRKDIKAVRLAAKKGRFVVRRGDE